MATLRPAQRPESVEKLCRDEGPFTLVDCFFARMEGVDSNPRVSVELIPNQGIKNRAWVNNRKIACRAKGLVNLGGLLSCQIKGGAGA